MGKRLFSYAQVVVKATLVVKGLLKCSNVPIDYFFVKTCVDGRGHVSHWHCTVLQSLADGLVKETPFVGCSLSLGGELVHTGLFG